MSAAGLGPLSRALSGPMQDAELRKELPPAVSPAGADDLETGLPPALEIVQLFRERHLLGGAYSCPGPADAGEGLYGSVHTERLRCWSGRGDRGDLSQAVPRRRVYRCAPPAFFYGMPDTRLSDPAPGRHTASAYEWRGSIGLVLGAER